MDWTNFVSLTLGVLGVLGTLYFGVKSHRLVEKIRKFDWNDIESGVKYLNREIERQFKPDIIVTTSAGSASVVASLFISNTENSSHCIAVYQERSMPHFTQEPVCGSFYTTGRWKTFIPDEVFKHKNARILILDDVT